MFVGNISYFVGNILYFVGKISYFGCTDYPDGLRARKGIKVLVILFGISGVHLPEQKLDIRLELV